jgi:hypothetical protein
MKTRPVVAVDAKMVSTKETVPIGGGAELPYGGTNVRFGDAVGPARETFFIAAKTVT